MKVKNVYICSNCNVQFETEEECKKHEEICGKKVRVKAICMLNDLVSGNPYFNIVTGNWAREEFRGIQEKLDTILVNYGMRPDSSYHYTVYTTDLSKEAENRFKIKLLNYRIRVLETRIQKDADGVVYIEKEIKKISRRLYTNKKEKNENGNEKCLHL